MADAPNPTPVPGGVDLTGTLKTLGARWGWFVALGVLMLVLGFVAGAYVLAATVASVLFVGAMMLVAGIGQLVQAWRVKDWRGFLFWTLGGLLYAIAGGLALYNPLAGAAVLTLLLGAFLIASGALRLWIWFQHRGQQGWGWLALSGAVTLLAGLLVAMGWPENSLWILGLLLSLDLLFQGITLVMLGLALRRGQPPASHA